MLLTGLIQGASNRLGLYMRANFFRPRLFLLSSRRFCACSLRSSAVSLAMEPLLCGKHCVVLSFSFKPRRCAFPMTALRVISISLAIIPPDQPLFISRKNFASFSAAHFILLIALPSAFVSFALPGVDLQAHAPLTRAPI